MASEKADGAPDLTLSFLDVIANGLGCLLVLFFLTTVLRAELAWPPTAATTSAPVESDQDPFVLLVTPSDPGSRLPALPDQAVPWRIEGVQQNLTAGTQTGWGADHAMLVLDRRPAPNAVIRLYLPPESDKVDCQWFTATAAGRAVLTPGGAPWIVVWPRPESGK